MGQLHAYLMMPTGQKANLQKTSVLPLLKHPVLKFAPSGILRPLRDNPGHIGPPVFYQIIHKDTFFFRKFSTDKCPVPFFHVEVVIHLAA